jgi:dipeptidyl aminopeptidase/acylaminoacyl peptidase
VTLKRLSDPQVSPKGDRVAFVLRSTDLEADRGRTDLWSVGLDGRGLTQLTTHLDGESNPRWAPSGAGLYFLSGRSGSSQIWFLPAAGGEPRQVTRLPLPVANLVVAPSGKHLAFSLEVYPGCGPSPLSCTVERRQQEDRGEGSGRLYEELFLRHWDTWKDGTRQQLFTLALTADGVAAEEPVLVSGGLVADVPSKPFGGTEEIAFTPDGQEIVFTARVAGAQEPWSTNFDLYATPVDGSAPPRNLTADNPAWDTQPVFSPDGKTLAFVAMSRPGYEADRFRLRLYPWPGGPARDLAPSWDRSAGSLTFTPDGKALLVTAQDVGNVSLSSVDVASGRVRRLVATGHVRSPQVVGNRLVYGKDTLDRPVDLYVAALDGSGETRITDVNGPALAEIAMGTYEQFQFVGTGGDVVYGYVVRPPGLAEGARAPIAFLIHGGPQGSFGNDFHYRWNPQVYAGAGYGAVMIDFHGSTGYGQAFTDAIRGDWGGKPLADLKAGLEAVVERYPWLDGDRACALGASYGGYMVNWIAGNWADRFRCLVNHDGIFDQRMMYYATEELWFPEWEQHGPHFDNPDTYEAHNPARFVHRWTTPMLVIHGELDFRVPVTQGIATFTALQRRGIPSQFLYFSDENHWVLRPGNSLQWHRVVLGWLSRWLREEEG